MISTTAISLEALRVRIRELEGHPVQSQRKPSGVCAIDALIQGLPKPGIVEICGPPGSGRLQVVLGIAAVLACAGQPIAWVDPARRLYPPAVSAAGVPLERSLWVCPSADREAWTVEQVARSGAFPVVVLVDPTVRPKWGTRWNLAAESGACTLVVTQFKPARDLQATVRLGVEEDYLVVWRDRHAAPGGRVALPARVGVW